LSGVLELQRIAAEPVRSLPLLEARPRRGRGRLIRRTLIAADLAGLGLAFLAAEAFYGSHAQVDAVHGNLEALVFLASLPLWIAGAQVYGLYSQDEQRTDHTTTDDLKGVLNGITLGTWLFFGATSLTGVAEPNLHKLATFWLLAIALVTLGRVAGRTFARRRSAYVQRALIVGANDDGRLVASKLARHPEYRIDLVGFVDGTSYASGGTAPVLGEPADLIGLIAEHGIDRVIFTSGDAPRDVLVQLVRELHEHDVQVDLVPPLYEVVGPTFGVHTVEGLPLLGLPPLRLTRRSRVLKRGVDIVVASVLLVLLAPVFALIALWIKLDSPGPVFFRQVRIGLGDRPFRIYKYRTMVADAEERKRDLAHLNSHLQNGDGRLFKIHGDPRVTASGRFLRRHYLDELPQLIDVLRGEMGLVGPRPLIPEEDVHVGEWGRKRLRLKPGMTGLWQVLGRSEISFEDMIKLDYIYVTNWSLAGDFRLLVQTAGLVARGADAS
jgi:exopolysaccharide biosynthesis polyprenyl glycosylphosphotransferase